MSGSCHGLIDKINNCYLSCLLPKNSLAAVLRQRFPVWKPLSFKAGKISRDLTFKFKVELLRVKFHHDFCMFGTPACCRISRTYVHQSLSTTQEVSPIMPGSPTLRKIISTVCSVKTGIQSQDFFGKFMTISLKDSFSYARKFSVALLSFLYIFPL